MIKRAGRTKLDIKTPQHDMVKINGVHDVFHSDSEKDDASSASEESEEKEVNSKFIICLIHVIRQRLDDESKNSVDAIYKELTKKINYYEWIYKLMKEDDIRIMLNNKMEVLKVENESLPINEFTIRKQVLLNNSEILKSIIRTEFDLRNNKEEEEVDDDDADSNDTMDIEEDDEEEESDDDSEPLTSQEGSGWTRKRRRRRANFYRN